MQERALGFVGAVEEGAKVGRDVGAGEVVFVGLAEEEAAAWRGFEELGRQEAAEAVEGGERGRLAGLVVLGRGRWRLI